VPLAKILMQVKCQDYTSWCGKSLRYKDDT
jgi:hypothetical protein